MRAVRFGRFVAVGMLIGSAMVYGCASSGNSATDDGATTQIGSGGGGDGGAGGAGNGLPLGATCTDDAECASELCEEVFFNLPDKVCVQRCRAAEDCPDDEQFFCEAISAGSIDGYCIPRSPAHCAACDVNADCGHFTEVCLDDATGTSACHIDCSLDPTGACPSDYSCNSVEIGNTTRQLCIPNEPECASAVGGYCDRIGGPLTCTRESSDGVCIGERSCDATTKRFSPCGAPEPICKMSCDDPDPTGCTVEACGNIADTVEHCGMCNNPCPGVGTPNASPTCTDSICDFNCEGEHYDVDGNITNGCEETDSPTANHQQSAAVNVGSFPCNDGSSNRNISGTIHSDMRGHVPAIAGFNATTGSAPDWYVLYADGGTFCQNEVVLTLAVAGSGDLSCYQLRAITNNGTYTCNTSAAGTCLINKDGTGKYSGNTNIHIEVKKTCLASSPGSVAYTVTGHL